MIDAVQLLAGIEDIPQREIEDVVSRRVRYFRKNVLDVRLCDWIDVRDLASGLRARSVRGYCDADRQWKHTALLVRCGQSPLERPVSDDAPKLLRREEERFVLAVIDLGNIIRPAV